MSIRGNRFLKILDRNLGPIILIFLKIFNSKRRITRVRKIVFFAPAAIGDTLLICLIAESLKEFQNELEITLIGTSEPIATSQFFKCFNNRVKVSLTNFFATYRCISNQDCDLFIDFGQWSKISAIYSYFSAGFRVGFDTPGFFRSILYDSSIKHDSSIHESENFMNLINTILKTDLKINPSQLSTSNLSRHQVVLHMYPSGEKSYLKKWEDDNWVRLIRYFKSRNYQVFLTGGPADKESIETFKKRFGIGNEAISVAGKFTLGETYELLSISKIVVSVNTGIMHLASIMDLNVISLNGPTNSKRWGGIGTKTKNLQSQLICSPCLNLGFEYGCNINNCMKSISFEEVITEIERIIDVSG